MPAQEGGFNFVNISEEGTFMRPDVTNDEAMDPNYIQQSLVPMNSETHSGAGKLHSIAVDSMKMWFD